MSQPTQQMVNVAEIQGQIQALQVQRNIAMDQVSQISGVNAVKDQQIASLNAQVVELGNEKKALEEKVSTLEKQVETLQPAPAQTGVDQTE